MTTGIDHVVVCARDLDAAAAAYERLGFNLTPPGQHPFGTGNRLAQLQGSFIELLAVTKPKDVPPDKPGAFNFGGYNQTFAEKREGMSMLALKSAGWELDRERLQANGLPVSDTFGFGRQATLPDGAEVALDFRLTFVTDPRLSGAAIFTCDHLHPAEAFWRPPYQEHPNGALGIGEAMMIGTGIGDYRELFADLFGDPALDVRDHRLRAYLDDGAALTLLTPRRFVTRFPGLRPSDLGDSPQFLGFQVTVADLDATRALFAANGVDAKGDDAHLYVGPAEAMGAVIEFVEEDESEAI